jgi:hypothetical protein
VAQNVRAFVPLGYRGNAHVLQQFEVPCHAKCALDTLREAAAIGVVRHRGVSALTRPHGSHQP